MVGGWRLMVDCKSAMRRGLVLHRDCQLVYDCELVVIVNCEL